MNIFRHKNLRNESIDIVNLERFLSGASCKITFWGKRIITAPLFSDSISVDEVAKRTFETACARLEAGDLTLQERIAGLKIEKIIKNFYKIKGNCFTRILNFIREFTLFPYTPRFFIENDWVHERFCCYSQEEFRSSGFRSVGSLGEYVIAREEDIIQKNASH